jgi:hypothetical protein
MRIFVGGSLRFRNGVRELDSCDKFVASLGTSIVEQGHILLNGCISTLDQQIAFAAHQWLLEKGQNPKDQIVSYCLRAAKPIHSLGTVRYSALADWQMNHQELAIPEQIEMADATVFVAGGEGTFWSRNWATFSRKLIFGIPRFGGAGETIYNQELKRLRETSAATADDYETLNSLTDDIASYAKEVIRLVERLVTPRNVFTIMSFKKPSRDVFASYKEVCQSYGFVAERTDQSTSSERIVPRIEIGIRKSAFVLVDLSDLTPNVFYEMGFARALGKEVIVTAKVGTQLPFDVGDIPTIFWEDQQDLKEGLEKRVAAFAHRSGRERH